MANDGLLVAGVIVGGLAAAFGLVALQQKLDERDARVVVKGTRVVLIMAGRGAHARRRIAPPASFGLLHDPTGQYWPSCSGLIAPFQALGESVETTAEARKYLGSRANGGLVRLPPRDLAAWTYVGDAERIYYVRRGAVAEGLFKHDFSRRVEVYRRGQNLRLELGRGCIWTWRGFVRP